MPRAGPDRAGVGRLELSQDVVAQVDRVREVLEPERVLGETGNREVRATAPSASTRLSQVISNRLPPGRDVRSPGLRVDRCHAAEQHLGMRAHLA